MFRKGNGNHFTARLIEELGLETVCESAKCPNRMECWSQQTATFMILGNVCTRPCGFCSVPKGKTEALSADEPERVAEAAERLGLKHVVITSVTRDDLADGGAEHFYRSVLAVRARTGAVVEVLTPDFIDKPGAVERVVAAAPEVFNHNTETVPRLYRPVRGRKSVYRWTLELLRPRQAAESGYQDQKRPDAGAGRNERRTARHAGRSARSRRAIFSPSGNTCSPRPSICRWCAICRRRNSTSWAAPPGGWDFEQVASGPFVRSSYHAREMAAGEAQAS